MRIVEIIPYRYWKNKLTGATASLYGAVPYANDKDSWEIVGEGYTFRKSDGTIGIYSGPVATMEEAQTVMKRINERK